jgi:hypothetical protein
MIGRGNHHRINVLTGGNLAKILRRETILVLVAIIDRFLRAKEAVAVHIARRDDLRVLVPEIGPEIPIHTMIARADEADSDAIVGGSRATHAEHGGGDNLGCAGGQADGGCGLMEETSASETWLSFCCFGIRLHENYSL